MRTYTILFTLLATIYTLSIADAQAKDDVYRWVDENGVVHFENQAPQQSNAEKITIQSDRSTNSESAPDTTYENTKEKTDTGPSYAQQRRDERATKRHEAAAKEKRTAATCDRSRVIVAKLEPMTRVLVTQEDGTVVRMNDNDRLEKLRIAKEYIAENCGK